MYTITVKQRDGRKFSRGLLTRQVTKKPTREWLERQLAGWPPGDYSGFFKDGAKVKQLRVVVGDPHMHPPFPAAGQATIQETEPMDLDQVLKAADMLVGERFKRLEERIEGLQKAVELLSEKIDDIPEEVAELIPQDDDKAALLKTISGAFGGGSGMNAEGVTLED